MLTLRRGQMQIFEPLVEAALESTLVGYLRSCFEPEIHALDDEQLLAAVRAGIVQGRAFGLTWESSLGAFVWLAVVMGPRFHEHPRVRAILTDEAIPPNARIDALRTRLSDEDWYAVRHEG